MDRSLRFISAAFIVLLLLLVPFESADQMVAEARTCESQSRRFKGPCVSRTNCANVCKTEGFPAGRCRGFRRRCFCVKKC